MLHSSRENLRPVGISIRKLLTCDLTAISNLHANSFNRGWSTSELKDILKCTGGISFIASSDYGLVGFIIAQSIDGEAEVISLAVDIRFRQFGIATRLLAKLEKKLRSLNGRSIILEVSKANVNAIKLYRKNGFRQISVRKSYYTYKSGKSTDALVYKKILHSDTR
ncbi:MAG: [Ribosomal protein S18]-alanine N-acetyltransferase [Hyphomicrobiaceae bacterium hypho_1]